MELLRRYTALCAALLLAMPAAPASADEGDVSFIAALGSGALLLIGAGLCTASDAEGEEYARDGFYVGAGASYALENYQQKGGSGGAGAWRRFVNKSDGRGTTIGNDRVGPCAVGETVGEAESGFPNLRCGIASSFTSFPAQAPAALNAANVLVAVDGVRIEDGEGFGVNGRVGLRCHPRAALEAQFEYLLDEFNATFLTTGRFIRINTPGPDSHDHVRRVRTSIEQWSLGGNSKLFLATGRVQPYVLGGLGIMRVKESSSRTLFRQEFRVQNPFNGQITSRMLDCTDPNSSLAGMRCFDPANPGGRPVDSDQFKDIDLAVRLGGGIDIYATENWVLGLEGSYVRATGRVEPYDYVSFIAGIQYRFGGGKKKAEAAD